MTEPIVPSTPIVELYDQLDARGIGREMRLALARGFVAIPGALAVLFADSVRRLQGYPPKDEFFYDAERTATKGEAVIKTHHLALRLRDSRTFDVEAGGHPPLAERPAGVREVPAEALGFDYIDRELVASRTTGGVVKEGTAVRLDLLLATTSDRTAVIGEVKIGTDKDAFAALEWWTPSDLPDAGVHRGHDEVRKHLSAWSGSFDEFEVAPLEFFESRECVIVRLVLKGRLRGSLARVQQNDLAQVWRFRGDRVIEVREYRTLREAQAAAGVR